MTEQSKSLNRGRMPWYSSSGDSIRPYIIGIAGGSASGKTSVAQRIIQQLGVPWVVSLSMDSFYKSLTKEQIAKANRNEHNFDHPDSFDYELLFEVLDKLKMGIKVEIPVYDFATHSRLDKTESVYGASVILFEGILALYDKKVREILDLKLFVESDADIRLARRLRRDISERGRSIIGVLEQYSKFVKPAFDEYIYPTVKYADIIVPRGLDNIAAIDVITKNVRRQLSERAVCHRSELGQTSPSISPQVHILPQKPYMLHLFTIIRDRETKFEQFGFYADQLSRIVVEFGLGLLHYDDQLVTTPLGKFSGKILNQEIAGVSIVRAGESMEAALRTVLKDIPIGKILIQTDGDTLEPFLHYCKLPKDISNRSILLVDAQIASGAAAIMAIRILLDHHVAEENIILMALLATPVGLASVSQAFPKVQIVVAGIDNDLGPEFRIEPGMGNFGDRYFGTEVLEV